MRFVLLPAAALLLVCTIQSKGETFAQEGGTVTVHAEPYLSNGKLTGCTLVFQAFVPDYAYSQGRFIVIDGNVGLMRAKGKLASILKVAVQEMVGSGENVKLVPAAPNRAYIIGPNYQTNLESLVSSHHSDTPGALLTVFQLSPTFDLLMQAFTQDRLTIAFNRGDGATDIKLQLQLDVEKVLGDGTLVKSPKAVADFADCAGKLATPN